ncbi:hypothetical protein JOC86_000605 [Bacillus pakistanensis]|uniref:DUF1737 domain-containing protein n=1 Tax=Rossellomorea pakistanensis TaxID=992288 RepID=A0ABS2N8B9_9BACI|nr:hypothetical protein [Bacillus pakistanensis]MBM7584068.1 hypothetical protein [Bacillus pakistanensis]
MSEYQTFLTERDQINVLIAKGYTIHGVSENLSGAFLEFKHTSRNETEILHITTADARKYFSNLLVNHIS